MDIRQYKVNPVCPVYDILRVPFLYKIGEEKCIHNVLRCTGPAAESYESLMILIYSNFFKNSYFDKYL